MAMIVMVMHAHTHACMHARAHTNIANNYVSCDKVEAAYFRYTNLLSDSFEHPRVCVVESSDGPFLE